MTTVADSWGFWSTPWKRPSESAALHQDLSCCRAVFMTQYLGLPIASGISTSNHFSLELATLHSFSFLKLFPAVWPQFGPKVGEIELPRSQVESSSFVHVKTCKRKSVLPLCRPGHCITLQSCQKTHLRFADCSSSRISLCILNMFFYIKIFYFPPVGIWFSLLLLS